MMKVFSFINKWWIYAIIIIVALIVFKLINIGIPYYWDESWSYSPAVQNMFRNGPSLLPGTIQPGDSRGHPLLFYFLASSWLKMFGNTTVSAHLFALTISVLLQIAIFSFAKKYFGDIVAIASLAIFTIQSVFLSQSAMLLPEVILALFSILLIKAYLDKKFILFNVFAMALLLTKETGVALIVSIYIFNYLSLFRTEKASIVLVNNLKLFLVPALVIICFFVLQKRIFGWYFFPEHIGMMKLSFSAALTSFAGYSNYIFSVFGRNVLTFTALIALIVLIIRKKYVSEQFQIIYLLLLFIFMYLLVLSVNFSTIRYVMSVIPVSIIICVYVIYTAVQDSKWIYIFVFSLVFLISGYYTVKGKNCGDHTLGYIEAVKVQKQAVQYLEDNKLYDKVIAANFLMRMNLSNPDCGYLSSRKTFSKVAYLFDNSVDYVVLCSFEPEQAILDSVINRKAPKVYSFVLNNERVDIYKMK